MAYTRILFVTAVHGSDAVWKKFIRGGQYYESKVITMGGDLTGKFVVTVIKNADGTSSRE